MVDGPGCRWVGLVFRPAWFVLVCGLALGVACGRVGYEVVEAPLAGDAARSGSDGSGLPDAAAPDAEVPDSGPVDAGADRPERVDPPDADGMREPDTAPGPADARDAGADGIPRPDPFGAQPPGTSYAIVGTTVNGFSDGDRREATLGQPFAVLWTARGLYIADAGNAAIRFMDWQGRVTTLFGRSGPGFADGDAQTAQLRYPVALLEDVQGRVLVADERNHAIRRIEPDGRLVTLLGGTRGYLDGPEGMARFNSPRDLVLAPDGAVLIADKDNWLIRRWHAGQVTLVCGQPGQRGTTDGDCAVEARLNLPVDLELLPGGGLLVCEWGTNVIRRLTPDGRLSTWSGRVGVRGYADGLPAEAVFSRPAELVWDAARGGLWLLEQEGAHRIRFFDGQRFTVRAGPATADFVQPMHVEGPDPRFHFPESLALDPWGCLTVVEARSVLSRYCP